MGKRCYNFSAGPAMLPITVLEAAAAQLLDFEGRGFGIAECSHRGKEFGAVIDDARARCRRLLDIPDEYEVLFLQGGATQQFSLVAMNFLRGHADYAVAGQWGKKALAAARLVGDARSVADSCDTSFDRITPLEEWRTNPGADYLHICSNNTIYGTRMQEWPQHDCLIADMSSEIMSRRFDVSRFGLIYAGAQKNLGPSGVVLVIVRKALLERCNPDLPPIFNYAEHAAAESCLNTPPTFGIAILRETFRWIEDQGGLAALEQRNEDKAALVYRAIDESSGFYRSTVARVEDRSRMNVTFTLPDEALTKAFLAGAQERGMVALKGYRSVGGVRASIYNAMPMEGCQALADYMAAFRKDR